MKKKYGEITMLDFPQFTKDTFPGVTHMDIFSGLFGDVTDDTMFAGRDVRSDRARRAGSGWTSWPSKLVTTGTKVQHISNNAPTNLAGPDEALRKAGVEVGKKWLEGCAVLGVEVDADELAAGARPEHPAERRFRDPNDGYPRNVDIMPLLDSGDRVVQGDGRLRRQSRHQGDVREPLGPGRRSDEHPDHASTT